MGRRAAEFLLANASGDKGAEKGLRQVLKQTFYEGNTIRRMK
jgi:hypothetical protein